LDKIKEVKNQIGKIMKKFPSIPPVRSVQTVMHKAKIIPLALFYEE
jgi:hypothetical protein